MFKYMFFDDNGYNLDAVFHDYTWMSYPVEFNDPFDAQVFVSFDKLRNDIYRHKAGELIDTLRSGGVNFSAEAIEELAQAEDFIADFAFEVFRRQHGEKARELACAIDNAVARLLTDLGASFRDQFQRGYLVGSFSRRVDSILMWSHYSQKHSGFCIEYPFGDLPLFDVRVRLLEPVIYRDSLFDATEYYRPMLLGETEFNNLFGLYVTMMKAEAWSYEEEWRIISPIGAGADEYRKLTMPNPKALYLGARISPPNQDIIVSFAKARNIPVYRMQLSDTRYGLEVAGFNAT